MSSTINQPVIDFLKYYTEKDRLDYAVLLDGPWGSGKTYLVRDFLENREGKHLFVSLYGITSVKQIDRERHPWGA